MFVIVIPSNPTTSLNLTVSLLDLPCDCSVTVITLVPALDVLKELRPSNRETAVSSLSGLAFCNACLSGLCDLNSSCGCFASNSD